MRFKAWDKCEQKEIITYFKRHIASTIPFTYIVSENNILKYILQNIILSFYRNKTFVARLCICFFFKTS